MTDAASEATKTNHILVDKNENNLDSQTASPANGTSVPVIVVKPGAIPAKRNVAVKNTSAGVKPAARTQTRKPSKNNYKDDEDDEEELINDSDKEGNILDYNSNDEYLPPKTESDGSDAEMSVKRKSARLSKKPKTLDEYEIGESSNDSSIKVNKQESTASASLSQPTQLQELDNNKLPQQPLVRKSSEQAIQPSQPKHFARKSTAPGMPPQQALTNSNQNFFNTNNITNNTNQTSNQIKTKVAPAKYTSVPITTVTSSTQVNPKQPVLTQIANGSNHSLSKSDHLNHSSSHSTNNACATPTITNQTTNVQPQVVKQYRNKIISCKPFYESKATECTPIVKDASTQVDLDEIKLNHTVVPVPVPIHVPVPMCMYQAAMPVPILVPLPIPVPVFIPTTKRTFNRVERKIQKLRKKLPSDPLEFELLLYAEKLAREEGIAGFEESSDGESEPDEETSRPKKLKSDNCELENHLVHNDQDKLVQPQQQNSTLIQQNEQEGGFKWVYGVRIFNTWLLNKIEALKHKTSVSQRLPDDILKLKNEELNYLLAEFVHEARKPTGEVYAPESIYYLCLGIQHYLQEKGRVENIFLDFHLFDKFQESLNEIALRYQIRIDSQGHITSRIEEEILWESKQLGAFSPFVLLNTILYFNTKYFFLDKPESHLQLSFTNVKKHSKRNIGPNGEDYGKSVFLRYYPDFHGLEQVIYEQGENYDNPLRCPVELYNFYLSKCPESVKNRSDVFYLLPEKASLPSSPVWFSSQPLSPKMLERMLNRIKMVKEVNELLIAASPTTAATLMQ